MTRAFNQFTATIANAEQFKLADLRANHIQAWIDKLTRIDGTPLSARAVAKTRQYVSTIITALYRRFDLAENPVDKLEPASTPRCDRLGIRAFDRPEHLTEMLETLGDIDSSWQALLAVAVLAGPRYQELTWLKISDIDFGQNLIAIHGLRDESGRLVQGTKTGKQRRTPIEQNVLRDILRKHVARRIAQQTDYTVPEAWRSTWLFPSMVPPNPFLPRTKSLAGQWSSNRVFLDAWKKIATRARSSRGSRYYWDFGPREWRHSACTVMGNSGIDAERGSAWVGNTPNVWRAHYCKPSSSSEVWPFKW